MFFAIYNTTYMATYREKLILHSYSSVGSNYQIYLLHLVAFEMKRAENTSPI
jgi:hypothetical protein